MTDAQLKAYDMGAIDMLNALVKTLGAYSGSKVRVNDLIAELVGTIEIVKAARS